MSTQFEKNGGHPSLPRIANVDFDADHDDDEVFLSFIIQDDDGLTVAEYVTDDAAEIQEFFERVDRVRVRYEVLIDVDTQLSTRGK